MKHEFKKTGRQDVDRLRRILLDTCRRWGADTPVEAIREDWEALFTERHQKADSEDIDANGVPATWIWTENARPDSALLYLHGGGYMLGSVASHWDLIAGLARASHCRALGIDYRLAPEHPYPAALEDAQAAYRWLLSQGIAPSNIVMLGDSAGGGLVLTTLLSLERAGLPMPAAAALLSPCIDLEATGESYDTQKQYDPLVSRSGIRGMADVYLAGKVSPRDPAVAPLHADLSALPPILIQVGEYEVLLDDARAFAETARGQGIEVTLELWDEMIHVFQLYANELEEGQRAIERIGEFVRHHLDGE
ncbi:alpha/beta hydrolase [Pseudohaliea sp.]|uniref:alpha/beta hydrolase n=1 Tax=Pseudohaliea sp. TaxID=2740289 RepID=UPI0032ECE5B9